MTPYAWLAIAAWLLIVGLFATWRATRPIPPRPLPCNVLLLSARRRRP